MTFSNGTVVDYESVTFVTLVEENGGLKVREFKDVSNPEKRANLYKVIGGDKEIA